MGFLPSTAQLANLAFVYALSLFWTLVTVGRTAAEFWTKGRRLFRRKARPLPPACLTAKEWRHSQVRADQLNVGQARTVQAEALTSSPEGQIGALLRSSNISARCDGASENDGSFHPTCPVLISTPSASFLAQVKLSKVSLHVVESGSPPAGAPLMLFVHGFPEFWYTWRSQLRAFRDTHRVVAVDLRGFGHSDKPSGLHSPRVFPFPDFP